MAAPKCLVCQDDIPEKRSRRSLEGASQEATLYTDALESYIHCKGLSCTAAEVIAGAEGQAYMCVKCGRTLRDFAKLKPQLEKIDTHLTTLQPALSTPTCGTPTLQTSCSTHRPDTRSKEVPRKWCACPPDLKQYTGSCGAMWKDNKKVLSVDPIHEEGDGIFGERSPSRKGIDKNEGMAKHCEIGWEGSGAGD